VLDGGPDPPERGERELGKISSIVDPLYISVLELDGAYREKYLGKNVYLPDAQSVFYDSLTTQEIGWSVCNVYLFDF